MSKMYIQIIGSEKKNREDYWIHEYHPDEPQYWEALS